MPAPKNLIYETSTTTGTGNFTVAAVNGYVRFSDATNGFGTGGSNLFDYFISNRAAAEFERGTGHMSDANTLVRDTVIQSSNANAAVNFSAGTKDVTNDVPAGSQYYIGGPDVAVADGGTGLSSGTSGGVLGYTASGTLASSVLLTANALVLGGGAGATPAPLGSLGTTTTVLHGNAAGAPTFGAVSLTADVSGDLPFANLVQGAALTVVANATNSTADFAAVAAASDNQVFRRSGTALAFGAVNLASANAVTGVLAAGNLPAASDTAQGAQENAVQSEMEAASSTTLTVTPGRQQFHPSASKCWVNWGVTTTILASYNTASITDNRTGDWTVNIATDFSSANYAAASTPYVNSGAIGVQFDTTKTAGTLEVVTFNTALGDLADPVFNHVLMFGDQ